MERVKEYISENKLVILILVISIFLGTYVRTANLYDGRFLEFDEDLSFTALNGRALGTVPFFNIVYKVPLLIWGESHHVALYTSAFWGVLSILAVFGIASVLFNNKVGSYSALIFSLTVIHTYYSRTGYACIFQTLLTLTAFLLFLLYLERQSYVYLATTGVFLGLSYLTYAPSYGAIITFFILLIIILTSRGFPLSKTSVITAVLGGCSLATLFLFEFIMRFSRVGSYFEPSFIYAAEQADIRTVSTIIDKLSATLEPFKHISYLGGELQLYLLVAGAVFCLIEWYRKRDDRLLLLSGFIWISSLVIFMFTILLFNNLRSRRLIFLIPFLCISGAYLLYRIELAVGKFIIILFLTLFSIFSFSMSRKVIENTFKIRPITKWLTEHNISKDEIATFLDISEEGDVVKTKEVLGRFVKYPQFGNYKISWRRMNNQFHNNGIRYLLTSGRSFMSTIGYNDRILEKIKPLKTWTHPYHLDYPHWKEVKDIEIYDLEDIGDIKAIKLFNLPDQETIKTSKNVPLYQYKHIAFRLAQYTFSDFRFLKNKLRDQWALGDNVDFQKEKISSLLFVSNDFLQFNFIKLNALLQNDETIYFSFMLDDQLIRFPIGFVKTDLQVLGKVKVILENGRKKRKFNGPGWTLKTGRDFIEGAILSTKIIKDIKLSIGDEEISPGRTHRTIIAGPVDSKFSGDLVKVKFVFPFLSVLLSMDDKVYSLDAVSPGQNQGILHFVLGDGKREISYPFCSWKVINRTF